MRNDVIKAICTVQFLKKALGYLIIAQIIPFLCLFGNIGETHPTPFLTLYLIGILSDIILLALFGLFLVVQWCFD